MFKMEEAVQVELVGQGKNWLYGGQGTALTRKTGTYQGIVRNKVGDYRGNRVLAGEKAEFKICHYHTLLVDK